MSEEQTTAAQKLLDALEAAPYLCEENGAVKMHDQAIAIIATALADARERAVEECAKVSPKRSETFSYQAVGYSAGWHDATTAYRAAIAAMRSQTNG